MSATGRIRRVEELPAGRRDEMFALMLRYYDGMRREAFEADLDEKDWVIELVDRSGTLVGFSSQMTFEVPLAGGAARVLFSGDTIVDTRHRRHNSLAGLWGRLALSLMERYAESEMYWFLIAKGYKTYRFLPVFFHEFYPRYDCATPRRAAELIDALGRHRYPSAYDPASGLVSAGDDACRLRQGVADPSPRLRDPHVHYFNERNPQHAAGDELCCIAPLSRENFTPAAWKVIHACPPSVAGLVPEHGLDVGLPQRVAEVP
ncbi:MAG: hypothetical protein KY476_10035 [Planctomycetes bacterium]|nr:hypothetical protein [Planctomycetota bacterium]